MSAETLGKFWHIILFAGSLIAGYATLRANVTDIKNDNKETANKVDNHETRISKMEEAYSQLPEIRQDIKQILKELNKK